MVVTPRGNRASKTTSSKTTSSNINYNTTHTSRFLDRVYNISVSYGVDIYDISENDLFFLLHYEKENFNKFLNKQILVAS